MAVSVSQQKRRAVLFRRRLATHTHAQVNIRGDTIVCFLSPIITARSDIQTLSIQENGRYAQPHNIGVV
jgi:hypothetical protein